MSAQRAIGVDVGGTPIVAAAVERDGAFGRLKRHATPLEPTEAWNAPAVAPAR